MTIAKTTRKLAALALTIGAVWLYGARASADVDVDDTAIKDPFVDGAVIKEPFGDGVLTDAVSIKEPPEEKYRGKTVILHSNDVMGAVDGYPRMAWLKGEFERMGAETILVDAGNFSVGPICLNNQGAAAVKLMNLTGYDAACVGLYELNYGYNALKRNMRLASFPFLCANAEESDEPICAPNYTCTTSSGLTIGFFGLLTPKTPSNFDLQESYEIKISKRRDIYDRVQEQIDALRREGDAIPGADVVIALSGIGSESENGPSGYSSLDIFSEAEGLDMILDGMSQSVMTSGPNGEMAQSCGVEFAYVGVVVIDDASKAIEDHYLIETKNLKSDETVLKAVETLQNRYKSEYGAVFARTETNLDGRQAPGNRTEETNLGDLIADAIVWTARRELKNPLTDENHMVGLTNGASIREGIMAGNITRNHVSNVFPFADTLSVVYLTGAELLEVLEASTWCLPEKESDSYPQTSGIVFTLDERIPFDAGDFYPDSQYCRPASVRRVRIDSIRGQPFDPNALYAVATNSYCAGGSDTFYLLGTADARHDFPISIEQSITDYIKLGLGGVVTEAMYGKSRGEHAILS